MVKPTVTRTETLAALAKIDQALYPSPKDYPSPWVGEDWPEVCPRCGVGEATIVYRHRTGPEVVPSQDDYFGCGQCSTYAGSSNWWGYRPPSPERQRDLLEGPEYGPPRPIEEWTWPIGTWRDVAREMNARMSAIFNPPWHQPVLISHQAWEQLQGSRIGLIWIDEAEQHARANRVRLAIYENRQPPPEDATYYDLAGTYVLPEAPPGDEVTDELLAEYDRAYGKLIEAE